ncbi:hypothetical protein M406DRAFT_323920 [Cryphonectria parasitica EP155]|uniref:Uncharacterized protein n=1 Tax=Cryphonectria parasitica (strain ATCC 38755 / EP155) TaxID=660469 RepID=A0A9P4XVY4_CRYP1|nr:uncharacterized protein M406DRAFT_323920 [Cryphonectria parasitica EP155]KAF3761565.1 hypothetical protein M406DRAFT_323920 [Cryphonectria parasitica EP155]
MSSGEGRESPDPETQTGAQLHDAPADGQGVTNTDNKAENNQSDLDKLTSNPKGPLDDAVKEKFGKSEK